MPELWGVKEKWRYGMKIEKAIERMKSYNKIHHDTHFDMAIAALEKQIPKQVNPETMNEETGVIAEMECPVCGHLAIGKQYGANYCPWCGQRLKWGPICNTTKLPCAGCNPCCESRS